MQKYLSAIKSCPLFYDIEESRLLKMLECFNVKIDKYDKKYTIIAEGTKAKYVGVVLSGTVHTVRVDYYGNRSIVSIAQKSDIFCEAFACSENENMPVSIIADEPCEIMLIESQKLMHPCANGCGFHNQLIFNLMKDLSVKNMYFHQKLEILSQRTTRDKLMSYLTFCQKKNESSAFEIPFDRQELADYLEVDRSGLSAEISKLKKEGIIDSNKNHFKLL